MTSNKYKLVPHHHSGRNPTFSSSLNHERSIPVVPNKAIGRLDLLPAALKSCASGNSSICSTCSMVKQAAPFLSKEMLTLTMIQQENSSSTSRSDIFTLGVHKNAVRLVRVNNDGKIEHGNGIGIKNGDVLSILLPVRNRIPLRIHYTFQIEGRESKEVEQVSSIQENSPQTSINTPKQTKMQQQLEGESSSSSPSPLRLARQNENSLSEVGSSSFEESPALTMPQNFGQDGGYSFESSAGSDLLTLQESRSNLSQRATRRLEYGSTSTCTGEQDNRHGRGRGRVLLSSLTIAELQEARDKCGNDDKGKLRRNFLDLVLVSGGGDQLPHLLKNTYIDLNLDANSI